MGRKQSDWKRTNGEKINGDDVNIATIQRICAIHMTIAWSNRGTWAQPLKKGMATPARGHSRSRSSILGTRLCLPVFLSMEERESERREGLLNKFETRGGRWWYLLQTEIRHTCEQISTCSRQTTLYRNLLGDWCAISFPKFDRSQARLDVRAAWFKFLSFFAAKIWWKLCLHEHSQYFGNCLTRALNAAARLLSCCVGSGYQSSWEFCFFFIPEISHHGLG